MSPLEIRLFVQQMESVATYPTVKLALRPILLTLVRKSELIQATWDEVDFENKTWTIPKQRMKGRNPHVVYLSRLNRTGNRGGYDERPQALWCRSWAKKTDSVSACCLPSLQIHSRNCVMIGRRETSGRLTTQ